MNCYIAYLIITLIIVFVKHFYLIYYKSSIFLLFYIGIINKNIL
nr:MAG TPA: hypothetical protein [Ackermannviridae sp.]